MKKILPHWLIVLHLPASLNNSILLSFDDGPSREVTPKVLEMLDKYNAKAMFFTVGHRIERCTELPMQVTMKGHALCNHTFSHKSKPQGIYNCFKDIWKCQNLNRKYGKQDLKIFRPPCGRISLTEFIIAKLLRMKVVFWSLEGQDWNCKSEEEATEIGNAMASKMSGGDIILLHDDNPNVLKILEIILEEAVSQGFNLKPFLGEKMEKL